MGKEMGEIFWGLYLDWIVLGLVTTRVFCVAVMLRSAVNRNGIGHGM